MLSQKGIEKAQALADRMFDLVARNGLMTTEDLAQGLGISRATFFRLFGSKEEALLMAVSGPSDQAGAALQAAPPLQTGETVWQLLRHAFEPVLLRVERDPALFRARLMVLRNAPELRAGAGKARKPRIAAITAALESRGQDAFAARIYAAAGVAAFETCVTLWAEQESGEDLRAVFDRAFASLAPAPQPR